MTKNKIKIIGSGISSLAASSYLAREGFDVEIFEKNNQIGGRARQFKRDGFTFDMGPTFYWMPDVFEKFFNEFGKTTADFYELKRLDPGYKIYFGKDDFIESSVDNEKLYAQFEKIEKGSSVFLRKFLKEAAHHYDIGVNNIVYKPGKSPLELVTPQTAFKVLKFLRSISDEVRKNIKDERLRNFLEFPVIFLGAKPSKIPAFYNFMNYADIELGTWHPVGGMFKLIEALETLAKSLGVKINTNSSVSKIITENKQAKALIVNDEKINADIILSGADYHHSELLLDENMRSYSEKYWNKKTFAPSAVLFYVGFDKKLEKLDHHSLFFDTDFNTHIDDIYSSPSWTKNPLFYSSFPSKSDKTVAPEGKEAGIFLIPIAPGINENKEKTEEYFEQIINRIELVTSSKIKDSIIFKETYSISDFVKDYNSYKGNAYGLANILRQTAFMRPKIESKKVDNLFFTGQLTVPGPGVPPSLISGKVASDIIIKKYHNE